MNQLSVRHTDMTLGDIFVILLVIGYVTLSRTFAHLGIAPFYVGDIALVYFLLFVPGAILRPLFGGMLRQTEFSRLCTWYYVFAAFGLIQFVRGLFAGYRAPTALQCLTFHVYPLFFFVGFWSGRRHSDALKTLIMAMAWCHAVYGVLFIAVFSPLGLTDAAQEGEQVGWFGQPLGASLCILGLVSFWPDIRRIWLPLLVNAFLLLGFQMRAAWVSFSLTIPVWGLLTGRMRQVVYVAGAVVGLMLLGLITDVRLPGPATRGGSISTRNLVGRALAAVDRDLASELSDDVDLYAGTVSWRQDWWQAIVRKTHSSPNRAIFGPGYGYPIWELHPVKLVEERLRTPHNVYVYALGYTGWLGVAIFLTFQASLAVVLWKVYRTTGQAFGICYWLMIMVWGFFDPIFETPYRAIPFFLLTGMAAAAVRFPETPRPAENEEHLVA